MSQNTAPGAAFGLNQAYRKSSGSCPDCDADLELTDDGQVMRLDILHDDTCPTWRSEGGDHTLGTAQVTFTTNTTERN